MTLGDYPYDRLAYGGQCVKCGSYNTVVEFYHSTGAEVNCLSCGKEQTRQHKEELTAWLKAHLPLIAQRHSPNSRVASRRAGSASSTATPDSASPATVPSTQR